MTRDQDYLSEIETLVERLGQDLRDLCRPDAKTPDLEHLNQCFRTAHSLKGVCNLDGRHDPSQVAHDLEDLLNALRLSRLPFDAETQAVLLEGLNLFHRLFHSPETGGETQVIAFSERVSRHIESSLKLQDGPGLESILPASLLTQLSEYEEHRLAQSVKEGKHLSLVQGVFPLESLDTDLHAIMEQMSEQGEVLGTLPWEETCPSGSLCLQLLVASTQRIANFQDDNPYNFLLQTAPLWPPEGVEQSESEARPVEDDLRSFSPSVRIDIGQLDHLVHDVGELFLVKADLEQWLAQMPVQAISGQKQGVVQILRRFEKSLENLRRTSLALRTVPVRQLLDRLWHVVRHAGDTLGKQVRFKLEGEDTRIDKFMMEELANPLMHLVRNAVDHGVESPEDRIKAGKDPTGEIRVSVRRVGQQLAVEVADDGAGVDLERLERIAGHRLQKGKSASEGSTEALDLIFQPGITTREETSKFSGRGVGLDAVKEQISRMSGRVQAVNQPGQGLRFLISLPATLSLTTVLVVEAGGHQFALPVSAVKETLSLKALPDQPEDSEHTIFEHRGQKLPYILLAEFFGENSDSTTFQGGFVTIAALGDRKMALGVDRIIGQQDALVRPLGPLLDALPGLSGAVVLGNDRLALLIDVGRLISKPEPFRGNV